jgi:hypothetical protein
VFGPCWSVGIDQVSIIKIVCTYFAPFNSEHVAPAVFAVGSGLDKKRKVHERQQRIVKNQSERERGFCEPFTCHYFCL